MSSPSLVPCLWFDHQAEEAASFYVSVIPDSRIVSIQRAPGDYPGGEAGAALLVEFVLGGLRFTALNGGPFFKFNEAVSLQIEVDDQAEMDRLYDALSAVPEAERCGWLKDRYGLSWQLVPRPFIALMNHPDPGVRERVFEAMMPMRRLDLAALLAAAED